MAGDETPKRPEPPVDVDVLVHDLSEQVATNAAAEREVPPTDATTETAPAPHPGPVFRDEAIVSRRPLVGPLITAIRRFFLRLVRVPIEDLVQQSLAGLAAEAAARERAERGIRELAERVNELAAIAEPLSGLEASLDHVEIAQRVAADEQRLLADELRARVAALHESIDRLAVGPRLARLERQGDGSPEVGAPPPNAPPAADEALDYFAFESRFRPEETVRERQQAYVEILRNREPVVDLGCGRGELVELLGAAGTRAYGVDLNADFVAAARERELDVRREDALAHLASLEASSLGGVVASHLIEHLPGDSIAHLVRLAFDRLADGGVLIVETPNPESLIAGSVNFHRDPTHVRPIHPETLEFLCESAGFARAEIRRLSPTPSAELLPRARRSGGGLASDLNAVVDELNARLYGYQDFAVVAWK